MKIQSSINGEARVSASNPGESSDLGALFDGQVKRESAEHDVDATMETIVSEPYMHCVPTLTGGFDSTTTNSESFPVKAPAWAAAMGRVNNCIMNDLGGGRRSLKLAWVINFQKLAAIPLLGAFISWYHNTSVAAWIYLSLQSTYGLAWIIKDYAFPDPNFHKRITIGAGVASFVTVLGWYLVFGWLLISGVSRPVYPLPDYAWFSFCISMCMLGSVIMIAADAQKYFTLRFKRDLITDGMYRFIRHPNYLGEMMTYGSLALMVWHWLPFVVLAWIWGGLFVVNMTLKEARMSRYPEWEQYKKRSWRLLPPVV